MAGIGWIRLHRSIWECELWLDDEPFSRRDAWIDLLLVCNRSPKRMLFAGSKIEVGVGQYVTTQDRLAQRWHWTRKKVRNYLKLLQDLNQITITATNRWSVITVVKYAEYQEISIDDGPAKGKQKASEGPAKGPSGAQEGPHNKNIENIEIDNKGISSNLLSTVVQQAVPVEVENALKDLSSFQFPGGFSASMADKIRACIQDVGLVVWAEAVKRSKGKANTPAYIIKVAYGLIEGNDYSRQKKNDMQAAYNAAMEGDLDDFPF